MNTILADLKAPYATETLIAVGIMAFVAGFILKAGIVFVQRKRILRLEDEMLSNHSRILSLEKKVADAKKDKSINGKSDFTTATRPAELKVS